MLEEKKRKKEQEASDKEERKKERERKKNEREELARKKAAGRLEQKKKKEEAALLKRREAAAKKTAAATKRHNPTKERDTRSSAATGSSLAHVLPAPEPTQRDTSTLVSADFIASASNSLPGPSSATASQENDQENKELNCECPFCFEPYCQDGQEWLECACGRWIHEQCIEEVIVDSGSQERFCPYCLN